MYIGPFSYSFSFTSRTIGQRQYSQVLCHQRRTSDEEYSKINLNTFAKIKANLIQIEIVWPKPSKRTPCQARPTTYIVSTVSELRYQFEYCSSRTHLKFIAYSITTYPWLCIWILKTIALIWFCAQSTTWNLGSQWLPSNVSSLLDLVAAFRSTSGALNENLWSR